MADRFAEEAEWDGMADESTALGAMAGLAVLDRHSRHGRQDRHDRHDRHERLDRHEGLDRHDTQDTHDRHDKHDTHDRHDRHDRRDRGEHDNRHDRQMRFSPIGEAGQVRLASAGVLVAGVGALGASLAQHMVRAGVGRVRIADRDYVEFSNLQRQVLFDEDDARAMLPKAVAAAAKLRRIDSGLEVEAHMTEIGPGNVEALLDGVDAVLDGLDNARTRVLLEAAARRRGIPFIYGGVSGSGGMTAVLGAGSAACLRCIIGGNGGDGATCESGGIISPAVEMIAALQAAEAIKWISGSRDAMRGGWLAVDVWPFRMRESALPAADPACPVCAGVADSTTAALSRESRGAAWPAVGLCGRNTVQVTTGRPVDLAATLAAMESAGIAVSRNPYLVRAALPEGLQLVLFADGRALVQGTDSVAEAERTCRHYVERLFVGRNESDGATI